MTAFESESEFAARSIAELNANARTAATPQRNDIGLAATSTTTNKNNNNKSATPLDYSFYKTFWSLQAQLRQPSLALTGTNWRQFELDVGVVLSTLAAQRVTVAVDLSIDAQEPFAKYLTSSTLLDLQLSDASFRRHVLLQLLIAFNTLSIPDAARGIGALQPQQTNKIAAFRKNIFF